MCVCVCVSVCGDTHGGTVIPSGNGLNKPSSNLA